MSTVPMAGPATRTALCRAERHRQPDLHPVGRRGRRDADHAGAAGGHAARGRRDRGERRHRLPRDRVPAVGAGPERHRPRRGRPALDGLRRVATPAPAATATGGPSTSPRQPTCWSRISSGWPAQWAEGGAARTAVTDDEQAGLGAILTGMGSLSYGEQAGERMRLGLMLNDPEEEHDCFSDNTHNSHYYDGLGHAERLSGRISSASTARVISGPSLSDLVAAEHPDLDTEMRERLSADHDGARRGSRSPPRRASPMTRCWRAATPRARR